MGFVVSFLAGVEALLACYGFYDKIGQKPNNNNMAVAINDANNNHVGDDLNIFHNPDAEREGK